MIRQAVILAGGKGTRLRERLHGLPKPLIDICGVPLLARQIALAKRYGIDRILILVSHAAQHIVEFCQANANWGITIECIDDGMPRGTAGAVLNALDRLDESFLVIYGDTMLEVDFARFSAFHQAASNVAATLFLHPNDHPHDSDLVEVGDGDRIVAFHPYPHRPEEVYQNLVNAGLYIVRKSALAPWVGTLGVLDFGKDLFPAMVARGLLLRGYNSPEYIKDCGTPARLDKICGDFTSGRIARSRLEVPQAAVFLDRDGTINVDVGFLAHASRFELLPGAAEAISRINRSEYRCLIVTNQPVLARGACTADELHKIHHTMETQLGRKGAYIDRIYYCPHHPDSGFAGEVPHLKINCNCRKPNTELVDRGVSEFNIALERSWMIGDTMTDILLARRTGLKSILVETGAAGLDGKYAAVPDFVAADLTGAVSFILDEYPNLIEFSGRLAARLRDGQSVLIGGLSRSGKTTLASGLRLALQSQGRNAVVISVDRWLYSADQRSPGVFGRYDLTEMTRIATALHDRREPVELSLPVYDRIRRERIDAAERMLIAPGDVVIFEGTIALRLRDGLGMSVAAYFVETDEAVRHNRVLREYRLRGHSTDEADVIYHSRQLDEAPGVVATAVLADECIRLPLSYDY